MNIIDWNELVQKIVEGLFLTVFLGATVHILLEKFKHKLSLSREINHERVKVISACWDEHSKLILELFKVHNDLLTVARIGNFKEEVPHEKIPLELRQKCDGLIVFKDKVAEVILSKKFWFNKGISDWSLEHLKKFEYYKQALCQGKVTTCEEIRNDIERSTLTADQLMKMILKELRYGAPRPSSG